MSCSNQARCTSCGCIGVALSIIVGALVGVAFAFGFLPGIVAANWVALGIGAVSLVLLIVGLFTADKNPCGVLARCLCENAVCLLIGAIGTIVLALLVVATSLVNFVASIIIVSLGALFLTFTIVELISLVSCIACGLCERKRQ